MKPLIGVTTSEMRKAVDPPQRKHSEPALPEMALGMTYVRALEAAGATPVVIPPLAPEEAAGVIARLDGLVLSGGPDLAPEAYGAEPHRELGPTEPALDAFEYAIARAASHAQLPLLGICRGAQTLNVARGGTLHQHLPDVVGEQISHRQETEGRRPTHAVEVMPGSRLAELIGATHLCVNSFHHQAIDRLGEGLVASAWAPDGTIEGVEDPSLPFLVGVQWHAETLGPVTGQGSLFRSFVAAVAELNGLPRAA